MRSITTLAVSLLLLGATASTHAEQSSGHAQQSSDSAAGQQFSSEDRRFVSFAAEDNQAEIQLCLLAEKRATSPAVKAFARLMVVDHVGIESRLAALINAEQVDVPVGVGKEGQQTMSRLEKLRGPEFDEAFMRAQVEDHTKDIEKFSNELDKTHNDVRRFAAETVPLLKQHLELAKVVRARPSADSGTVGQSPSSGR